MLGEPSRVAGPLDGKPVLTVSRLGQQSFKSLIFTSYGCRRAGTGDKIEPCPGGGSHSPRRHGGGKHRIDNGLLLRSGGHTLFDGGYLARHQAPPTRQPRSCVLLGAMVESPTAGEGDVVTLPERRADRPSKEFVEWHNDTIFRTL